MGYARTKLEEATERVKALEDQLGDWNATFPNRTASDAIALLQQANTERDALKAKLEAAKRACGEMREALELARHKFITQHAIDLDQLNSMPTPFDNALSSTCGSGYKSPTEYEALQKENEQLRKALKPTIELIERCVVHYYDPMNERYHLQKELTRLSALVKEPQSLAK